MGFTPTVRIRPPGGTWSVVGVDFAPGVVPEGLTCTATEWGPDTCGFTLKRDAVLPWSDLLPFSQLEVEVPGCGTVWGGRVWEVTPSGEDAFQVQARGHHYMLDDDPIRRMWVRQSLGGFTDTRTMPGSSTLWMQNPAPSVGGTINLQLNPGTYALGAATGVVVDLGPSDTAAAIDVDYVNLASNASVSLYLRGADDVLGTSGISDAYITATTLMAGSATVGGTFSSGKRYVQLILVCTAAVSPAAVVAIQITGVRLYRSTGYRSSNQSVLLASDVVKDVLTLVPALNQDQSLISTTGLIDGGTKGIPHMSTADMGAQGYATPRAVLQAANAYHDWRLQVGADARLRFQARPSAPATELTNTAGVEFSDAGDSAEELFNKALVQYQDAAGTAQTETRTSTSPLLGMSGVTRTKIITVDSPTTQGAAQAIGDSWLQSRTNRPTRGTVPIRGTGAARQVTGAPCLPAEFLGRVGEVIRLPNRWSPDDGGWGRDGTITGVSWSADDDVATLTLESPKDRLDVLLGRLAAVRGSGLPLQ